MKILCFTDSLNSGGAQRQLCMLATLLKEHGYDVEFLTYYDYAFYRGFLDKANIPHKTVTAGNKLGRIAVVRTAIRQGMPDVVIAYQETPSIIAEFAGLPRRNFGLIVSERNTDIGGLTPAIRTRFFLHRFADAVVPNSYAQQRFICEAAPYLAKKLTTIINCVDTDAFRPIDNLKMPTETINILIVSNFKPQKNPLAMVEAMRIVHHDQRMTNIVVDWYGNNWFVNGQPTAASALYLTALQRIGDYGLAKVFRLHNTMQDVARLYQGCTTLCLPSLYEGCSNVIGEAMACGKPVLASNVCDNPLLVKEGENGFLFDPADPQDIAATIIRFAKQDTAQWSKMGKSSRQRAEKLFSPLVFVNKYIELIEQIVRQKRV